MTDYVITPRQQRLHRAATILSWAAIINAVLVVVIFITGLMAASSSTNLFQSGANLTLARFDGTDDAAFLAAIMLLLVNVCALLVLMIGIMAQEIWAIPLIGFIIAGNVALMFVLGFIPGSLSIIPASWAGIIVLKDLSAFRFNPVMMKELRERMRGSRAFVVITAYLGMMGGFTLLVYLIQRGVVENNASAVTGELGRTLFAGVVGMELLLIIFIAPAFTAGAVANERERKTYDLLQITLLPKPSFILGKLESAMSYIFLLLLAAIPLQSVAFLFGGVSEIELVLAFVVMTVTAVALGSLGMFYSTVVDRTLTASIRAYTTAIAITIGIPIVFAFFINIFDNAVSGTGTNITDSPVVETILIYLGAILVSLNPVLTSVSTQQLLIEQQEVGFWSATLSSNGSIIPMVSPWLLFTLIYLTISTLLIVISVRRMRLQDGKEFIVDDSIESTLITKYIARPYRRVLKWFTDWF